MLGERGNRPSVARLAVRPGRRRAGPFRLWADGWGGGCVVVTGVTTRLGVRESRTQGKGSQQVCGDGYWKARRFSPVNTDELEDALSEAERRVLEGGVYAAFVLDVFSRRIVGWQLSTNLYTELALDALNMAIWTRQRAGADLSSLIHHSDRGVQYVAVRYTERLAEAEAVASVGSVGDSYDNAMAEAFNSLFKAELIRNKGPWVGHADLEVAVAEYIDWYNHRRLHGEINMVPPAEHEATYAATQDKIKDVRQPAGA